MDSRPPRRGRWIIMGVKCRACVAIVFILLLLGSMWLHGNLEDHWNSCPKVSSVKNKGLSLIRVNSSDDDVAPLRVCPGNSFQVANLLAHLQAAPLSTNDVLLKPYLASWDELIKFLEALGPMVGLISQEIESKTAIIRDLTQNAEKEAEKKMKDRKRMPEQSDRVLMKSHNGSLNYSKMNHRLSFGYTSVRSMIKWELENGLVDFHKQTNSGCRTLLRLHRALLWLQNFLQELGKDASEGEHLRSPSDLCKETYQRTLAHHHTWWVRKGAELAFLAMPERPYFYQLVCVETQSEAAVVLNRVVRAIGEVYERNEVALQEHGMLDLP
ncbi:ceramide-1-phosphate transfer protein-like [Carassius auratus]|uniref:Ceramide-1-phosphate transfer protein-like n=1 Tax=Carassius auratus TaxID=7957 RepID=A0A6P6N9C0_CARAU|nr:ceramide-1-phosphate transfer protein-like [Carassius auratus]XP_026105647.1 ceramide-1-phosphate transfer protein-like [Carassius auratus]